ncbi:YJU2 splicing factor homolog [Puma concolor]|uniref:YJU2 splicing factor homolog n=1 Tax=Puma concolor TaxID=9696 RepID=A0A6P6H8T0_PUMCO|nr:YJU2 splicing factor homolog [Puma concolor]
MPHEHQPGFWERCKTCGEYIYKGKKFNARKETVQNEAYLGLPIFRFYIKCTRCLAEITFKAVLPQHGLKVHVRLPLVQVLELLQAPKAKRKAESWERSVGTLGNRPPLSGLVVVKKTDPGLSTRQGQASPTPGPRKSGKAADPAPWTPGTSSLSQLGAYSDSEDSSGSS